MSLPTEDKDRKALPLWTFFMEYFPDVFLAVANVSIAGNQQHNPGEKLHWAREKSTDQMNTAFRHMFDYGRGVIRDTDNQYHLAKAIWRLSAELQLLIERERDGNDTRRKGQEHGEDIAQDVESVLAHAGAERDGIAFSGLSRVPAGLNNPGDGGLATWPICRDRNQDEGEIIYASPTSDR